MRLCLWSGSSFDEWFPSYHLILELIKAMLNAGHEVFLVQIQRSDGKMPKELQNQPNLHVTNVPQPATEKENFAKRYIKGCLLSQKPTVVSMDLDSDMTKKLSSVDQWTVVAPGDARAMADAILKYYKADSWDVKSKNAGTFLAELGPIENAEKYVKILEQIARK